MFLVGMYLMERVQFMASFAETFDICRKGYFPPIRAAVEKIAMDEFEIHAQFGQEVLRIVLAQPDGMTFYAQCRDQIVAVINELFRSEITWLKWLRRDGDHEGFMTYDESVSWLEFNCTAAAVFLGLNEEEVEFNFVTKNPLPWMKSHMNLSDNQASPQEEDANAYMVNIIRPDDMGKVFEFKHPALAFMLN
jgi:ribonucleoside-diphosphate reductase beta chain